MRINARDGSAAGTIYTTAVWFRPGDDDQPWRVVVAAAALPRLLRFGIRSASLYGAGEKGLRSGADRSRGRVYIVPNIFDPAPPVLRAHLTRRSFHVHAS